MPADHWAYEALARVQQDNRIIIGYGSERRRPLSRTVFALATAHELNKIGVRLRAGLTQDRQIIHALVRLLNEFTPELERLGVNVSPVKARLEAAKVNDSFPDVPARHWAYWSVEHVRSSGVLAGYPDGTFNGRNTSR